MLGMFVDDVELTQLEDTSDDVTISELADITQLENAARFNANLVEQGCDDFEKLSMLSEHVNIPEDAPAETRKLVSAALTCILGNACPDDAHPYTMLDAGDYTQLFNVRDFGRSVAATARRIWRAIKEAIRRGVEFIKKLWRKYFGAAKKMSKKLEDLQKRIRKAPEVDDVVVSVSNEAAKFLAPEGMDYISGDVLLATKNTIDNVYFQHIDNEIKINDDYVRAIERTLDRMKNADDDKSAHIVLPSYETEMTTPGGNKYDLAANSDIGGKMAGGYKFIYDVEDNIGETTKSVVPFLKLHKPIGAETRDVIQGTGGNDLKMGSRADAESVIAHAVDLNNAYYSKGRIMDELARSRHALMQIVDRLVSASDENEDISDNSSDLRKVLEVMKSRSGKLVIDTSEYVWRLVRHVYDALSEYPAAARKAKGDKDKEKKDSGTEPNGNTDQN